MHKIVKTALYLLVGFSLLGATTPHSIAIDGTDDFAADEVMETVGGITLKITWDGTHLFFGIAGVDLTAFSSSHDWIIFIDINQTNGTGAISDAPSSSVVTFNGSLDTHYEPEFAIFVEDELAVKFFVWTGTAWDAGVPLDDPTVGGAHAITPTFSECAIPFSKLGSPPGVALSSAVENEENTFVAAAYAGENMMSPNTLPDVNWFYQFFEPHVPGPMPVSGFSPGSVDHSLPVSLSQLMAIGGDGQVILRWRTESEIENQSFLLERKTAGEDYSRIAEIPGKGTTSIPHDYQYVDVLVVNGIQYTYRLADRDFSGNITYHPPVTATPAAAGEVIQQNDFLPVGFRLAQNVPNPFNPTTQIKFELPATTRGVYSVELNIFSIDGQLVRRLVKTNLAPGQYQVLWDARNNAGRLVPSGLYIYQLKLPTRSLVRKMILLK